MKNTIPKIKHGSEEKLNGLTKVQQKELYEKIGRYASKKLVFIKDTELLYKEISERCFVPQNRISEIVNKNFMNEPCLIGLLGGGILTVDEITGKIDLTLDEKTFLKGFVVHENKHQLAHEIIELRKMGGDPLHILREARRLLESQKD